MFSGISWMSDWCTLVFKFSKKWQNSGQVIKLQLIFKGGWRPPPSTTFISPKDWLLPSQHIRVLPLLEPFQPFASLMSLCTSYNGLTGQQESNSAICHFIVFLQKQTFNQRDRSPCHRRTPQTLPSSLLSSPLPWLLGQKYVQLVNMENDLHRYLFSHKCLKCKYFHSFMFIQKAPQKPEHFNVNPVILLSSNRLVSCYLGRLWKLQHLQQPGLRLGLHLQRRRCRSGCRCRCWSEPTTQSQTSVCIFPQCNFSVLLSCAKHLCSSPQWIRHIISHLGKQTWPERLNWHSSSLDQSIQLVLLHAEKGVLKTK